MTEFIIRVNGVPLSLWDSVSVTRSIDENCGSFSFVSTYAPTGEYPVKVGDEVQISINGISKINGFIEETSSPMGINNHTINLSGRDNMGDLIDSSLPTRSFGGDITFAKLCELVIESLNANIPVIDESLNKDKLTETEISGATGDTCIDFLNSFARKRNVFLIPSGAGDLIIYNQVFEEADTPLLNLQPDNLRNNIKERSWNVSYQNLFNKYSTKSQDNVGWDFTTDYQTGKGIDRTGFITDDSIRASRFTEIVAEESMSDAECLRRAEEESNIRRARSLTYTCVVPGVEQQSGVLWDFGLLVSLTDTPARISGKYLIQSVTYSMSLAEGSQTTIVCTLPDAYKVTAVPSALDARKFDFTTAYRE